MTDDNFAHEPALPLEEPRAAKSPLYPWYDSSWLSKYSRAKSILQATRPDLLPEFVDDFRVFHTRPDFEVTLLEQPFDALTMEAIRGTVRSLRAPELELHETRDFGRFLVHDLPFFTKLQQQAIPLVSEAVGEPVEASYNFLSLYSSRGVCSVHLDAPCAKWTFDLCIDQNVAWPIYFSQVTAWPESAQRNSADHEDKSPPDWQETIRRSPSLRFTPCTLQPGQAAIFSGSSQWHYRDPMPRTESEPFCTLLFFHYIPAGTQELVLPKNWVRLFGVPELSLVSEDWNPRATTTQQVLHLS